MTGILPQSLQDIVGQIFYRLDAYRYPQQVGRTFWKRPLSGQAMLDQTLYTSEAGGMPEDPELSGKSKCFLLTTPNENGQHSTKTVFHLFSGDVVVDMRRKTRIKDFFNFGMTR